MNPRRIVFLDIDGVLSHFGSAEKLDPVAIYELNRLVTQASAQLVLVSTWRDTYGIAETERRLMNAGLRHRISDASPRLARGTRSDEIESWLAAAPADIRFVILDDVLPEARLRSRTVLVDDFVGLTASDVDAAIRILNIPRSATS